MYPSLYTLLRAYPACAAVFLLAACGSTTLPSTSHARIEAPESFEEASTVEEDQLSDMRGGFMVDGLSLNFSLTSSTYVDGVPQSSLSYSSGSLAPLSPSEQQTLQNGLNNSYSSPAALDNYLRHVLQNSKNDTVIKSISTLNLLVSGLANVRNQVAALNSIGPLVRALH